MALQSVSRNTVRVLWLCHTENPVKKGLALLKAGIQVKLEKFQHPHKLVNTNTGQIMGDAPDTGPGTESWVWNKDNMMLELTKAESDHLKEGFDAILDSKGFPAILSIGVAEASDLFVRWSATIKPEPAGSTDTTEDVKPLNSPPTD